MLVLAARPRRTEDNILLLDPSGKIIAEITVTDCNDAKARLGITADSFTILRRKLYEAEQAVTRDPVDISEAPTPLVPVERLTNLDCIAAGSEPELHGRTEMPALRHLMDEQRQGGGA